jgi:hypothetical protein
VEPEVGNDMKIKSTEKENLLLWFLILFLSFIPFTVVLVSCGGGGGGGDGGASTGTVTTTITDPPVCLAPDGPFKSVWVTITRVRAHTSGDANSSDGGWADLVDLRNHPMQIDLLSLTSTTCLLTQLGSTSGIPAGKYQQIRIYLLSNSPASSEASPSPNRCGVNGFNCVILEDNSIQTLLLSSESQTGIKIPPGQISGGGLTVAAGQSVDLNIDFDACTSIVQQGNGQFRLKPTLRAGEISINTNSISGRVIDQNTGLPVPGAVVMLETRDPDNPGIDRMVNQRLTGTDGRFIFCPLPQGTSSYDVVAAAQTGSATYNATVTLQVPPGRDMGDIPLVPETGGTLPATISGRVTTTTAGSAPTSADVQLSALQSVPVGTPLLATIPLFANSTPNVATQSGITCPSGTDCADYTLIVPASNPQAGVFRVSPPTSYTAPAGGSVVYSVEARAFVPMSGSQSSCSPSDKIVPNINVAAGAITSVPLIFFTGCQ